MNANIQQIWREKKLYFIYKGEYESKERGSQIIYTCGEHQLLVFHMEKSPGHGDSLSLSSQEILVYLESRNLSYVHLI